MTSAQGSGNGLRLALLVAALAVLVTVIVAITAGTGTPRPMASAGSTATAESVTTSGSTSSAPSTVAPTETTVAPSTLAGTIDCRPDQGPMPRYLAGDPCPSAIVAVELAVAPVRLPIAHGDRAWAALLRRDLGGYGSPAACFGPMIRPGQYMHAYVSFVGSQEVGVVMLGLDLPADDNDPFATRPPWHTTLVAVEVPPAGRVMP